MFDATKEDISLTNDKNLEAEVLGKVVILMVTVSNIENLATRSYLQPLDGHKNIYKFSHDEQQSEKAIYYIGKYGACPTAIRKVLPHSEVLGGASSVPRMAYNCFPNLGAIIGVGVACGVEKKVKICDILVSSKVINYGKGMEQDRDFIPRGEVINASPYLNELFSQPVSWPNDSTKERLNENGVPVPEIRSGIILSGPYLTDDPVMKKLLIKDFASEAIGIEMEGAYLFALAQQTSANTIIVKAVCDFGDGMKSKEYQPTASLMAAGFINKHLSDPDVLNTLIRRKGSYKILFICLCTLYVCIYVCTSFLISL